MEELNFYKIGIRKTIEEKEIEIKNLTLDIEKLKNSIKNISSFSMYDDAKKEEMLSYIDQKKTEFFFLDLEAQDIYFLNIPLIQKLVKTELEKIFISMKASYEILISIFKSKTNTETVIAEVENQIKILEEKKLKSREEINCLYNLLNMETFREALDNG